MIIIKDQVSYMNLKSYIVRVIDYFEKGLVIKVEPPASMGGTVLFDLGERTIATEAIFFIYNHLKYIQNRVTVKLIS